MEHFLRAPMRISILKILMYVRTDLTGSCEPVQLIRLLELEMEPLFLSDSWFPMPVLESSLLHYSLSHYLAVPWLRATPSTSSRLKAQGASYPQSVSRVREGKMRVEI